MRSFLALAAVAAVATLAPAADKQLCDDQMAVVKAKVLAYGMFNSEVGSRYDAARFWVTQVEFDPNMNPTDLADVNQALSWAFTAMQEAAGKYEQSRLAYADGLTAYKNGNWNTCYAAWVQASNLITSGEHSAMGYLESAERHVITAEAILSNYP